MIPSILTNQSVQHVLNINWNMTSEIAAIPNLFPKYHLSTYYISDENSRDLKNSTIIDLSKRLNHLQTDLDKYNPTFIQRIINFFNGRLFTHCRLRRILPQVNKIVNAIATKILAEKAQTDLNSLALKYAQDTAQAWETEKGAAEGSHRSALINVSTCASNLKLAGTSLHNVVNAIVTTNVGGQQMIWLKHAHDWVDASEQFGRSEAAEECLKSEEQIAKSVARNAAAKAAREKVAAHKLMEAVAACVAATNAAKAAAKAL